MACGASSPAAREPVAVHASVEVGCPAGAECVTVRGNPCSPCPACPNAPSTEMTRAEYVRLTALATCESTHPKKTPSACIPCES
jgi:hypothetical protein